MEKTKDPQIPEEKSDLKQPRMPQLEKNRVKIIITILIFIAVILLEVFLFARYSVWIERAKTPSEPVSTSTVSPISTPSPASIAFSTPSHNTEIVAPPPIPPNPPNPPSPQAPPRKREVAPLLPPHPSPGQRSEVVNAEALKLMEKAPSLTYLRGILKLENDPKYYFAPEREKSLLEACKEIKKNWDNKEKREESIKKAKYIFFSGLNETQTNVILEHMDRWEKEPGRYDSYKGELREKYLLDDCIQLLTGRVSALEKP